MDVSLFLDSNSTVGGLFGEDFNKTSKKGVQDEGVMFAFIFCSIFVLMIVVVLVLVCKVCALRRAIVPDVYGTEFGEGGRALALRLPAFNKQ